MVTNAGDKPLAKIAEGREAELFAYGDGRVLRLYRDAGRAAEVAHQALVLRAAAAGGIRVPATYEAVSVNGRPGLVQERIEGDDLLEIIARAPWRLWTLTRLCARLQAAMHGQAAPPEFVPVREAYRRAISRAAANGAPPLYTTAALERLDRLPDGDRILHGDFHPANVMLAQDGPVIIDWTNATRGSPEADFARTMMMLRLGEPPPGAPLLIRVGAGFARSFMIRAYEATYRKAFTVDEPLYNAWRLPVAVARIAEGIPEEVPKLHKLIRSLVNSGQ
jgi:aminoglycoside phosphotransferase (APT) family kinase protein